MKFKRKKNGVTMGKLFNVLSFCFLGCEMGLVPLLCCPVLSSAAGGSAQTLAWSMYVSHGDEGGHCTGDLWPIGPYS